MSATRCTKTLSASLLRVLAVYLALILGLQGVAAAHALGSGPLHHHRDAPASVASTVFSHHGHAHQGAERHHHAAVDPDVLPDALVEDGLDTAAFALTAALALLALGATRTTPDTRRHVWRPTAGWAWSTAVPTLLLRPPRRG